MWRSHSWRGPGRAPDLQQVSSTVVSQVGLGTVDVFGVGGHPERRVQRRDSLPERLVTFVAVTGPEDGGV